MEDFAIVSMLSYTARSLSVVVVMVEKFKSAISYGVNGLKTWCTARDAQATSISLCNMGKLTHNIALQGPMFDELLAHAVP